MNDIEVMSWQTGSSLRWNCEWKQRRKNYKPVSGRRMLHDYEQSEINAITSSDEEMSFVCT